MLQCTFVLYTVVTFLVYLFTTLRKFNNALCCVNMFDSLATLTWCLGNMKTLLLLHIVWYINR